MTFLFLRRRSESMIGLEAILNFWMNKIHKYFWTTIQVIVLPSFVTFVPVISECGQDGQTQNDDTTSHGPLVYLNKRTTNESGQHWQTQTDDTTSHGPLVYLNIKGHVTACSFLLYWKFYRNVNIIYLHWKYIWFQPSSFMKYIFNAEN